MQAIGSDILKKLELVYHLKMEMLYKPSTWSILWSGMSQCAIHQYIFWTKKRTGDKGNSTKSNVGQQYAKPAYLPLRVSIYGSLILEDTFIATVFLCVCAQCKCHAALHLYLIGPFPNRKMLWQAKYSYFIYVQFFFPLKVSFT